MPVNTSISKLWGNKRNAYVSEILFPPLPISDDLKNIIDSARIWWDLHAHCYLKFHKCKHFGKELGSKCIETFINGHSSFISHPKEKHEIHSTIMNKKSHHFFSDREKLRMVKFVLYSCVRLSCRHHKSCIWKTKLKKSTEQYIIYGPNFIQIES